MDKTCWFSMTSPFPCYLTNRIIVNPSIKSQWEKNVNIWKYSWFHWQVIIYQDVKWLSGNMLYLPESIISASITTKNLHTYFKHYFYKWKLYTWLILHVRCISVVCFEEKFLWSEISASMACHRVPNSKYPCNFKGLSRSSTCQLS